MCNDPRVSLIRAYPVVSSQKFGTKMSTNTKLKFKRKIWTVKPKATKFDSLLETLQRNAT